MTTTTPETIAIPAESTRRPSVRRRFAIAFVLGLLVALAAGVGAIYAYDQQYLNRVLPGVRIGTVGAGVTSATGWDATNASIASLATRHRPPTRLAGSLPLAIQRWTDRVVAPIRAAA